MSEKRDLLKSLAESVRKHVAQVAAGLSQRLDVLERKLSEIPAGPKGEKGDPGESIKGDKGDPGESIKGDPGERGEKGERGESIKGDKGEPGIPGKNAEPIHPDTISLMVVREAEKAVAAMPKPRDGQDGQPGRDALQIEILPMVEEGKSYPRGTFAKHKGGLIRAVRNTGPFVMAELEKSGWEVVVEGIQNVLTVIGPSHRSFTIEFIRTSGYVHVETFRLPVILYREIYRDGTEYEQGDVVTYDGCAWHCSVETTKARPGSSADWKMMVRKGNAGKDGQSIKGDKGDPGKDGRDLTMGLGGIR